MDHASLTSHDVLGPNELVSRRLRQYEYRPQQLGMAKAIENAIDAGRHLIAEAGTGVGKSFAYLVPAILDSVQKANLASDGANEKSKPIIVSTHTISLQEQLIGKDIPFLNSILPLEFSAILVKGRRNYLSKRRLESAWSRSASLFSKLEESDQLNRLVSWAGETSDGTLADLDVKPLANVWDEVVSDSGNCMGKKCRTYQECFYYQARRRMQNAQILVVNHALFFTDLSLRQSGVKLLPDYDTVILDEAHTIESVAGDHLGLSLTSGQIEYQLKKLYNDQSNKGLLVHHGLVDAQKQVVECYRLSDEFFSELYLWSEQQTAGNASRSSISRVRKAAVIPNRLSSGLMKLANQVRQAASRLTKEEEKQDLNSAHDRLKLLSDSVHQWIQQTTDGAVHWLEFGHRRSGLSVKLVAAPIDVGPALRTMLFEPTKTVVLTSATLSLNHEGNFDYYKARIGLTSTNTIQLDSPFDYAKQAKLICVPDMPDPGSDRRGFEESCVQMIQRYVERTQGHAFVLFTSYDMMRKVGQRMTNWLVERDLAFYSQADGTPRGMMIESFKKNPRGVLFGTDSFWQGVDVPGEALQNVIITKLPFAVPDHPLIEARLDRIQENGGNPFAEYSLPEAVVKFRQGFGRLIRTQEDKGIVVVLDPRIQTKFYGRLFLDSLPNCQIENESIREQFD